PLHLPGPPAPPGVGEGAAPPHPGKLHHLAAPAAHLVGEELPVVAGADEGHGGDRRYGQQNHDQVVHYASLQTDRFARAQKGSAGQETPASEMGNHKLRQERGTCPCSLHRSTGSRWCSTSRRTWSTW